MRGAICRPDILLHPFVTVRAFGWRVFFQAIVHPSETTFLGLLKSNGFFEPAALKAPELIQRCMALELQAAAIYGTLADRFADAPPLCAFLAELAAEEYEHADLLRVCTALAGRGRFQAQRVSRWCDCMGPLEEHMQDALASLDRIGCVEDVAQLVLQIEGSEVNHVFRDVIAATDSPFVKKLGSFQRAVRRHLGFVCQTLPMLASSAAAACQVLQAAIP